jgi:hypothetical protein
MHLSDQWAIKEIREEIKKILKSNQNGNKTYQNLWYGMKMILRWKFIAMNK